MVVIAKKFGTYVSLGNNHVPEKKEFKLFWKVTLFFFLWEQSFPQRKEKEFKLP
jgi:hypothetical protein